MTNTAQDPGTIAGLKQSIEPPLPAFRSVRRHAKAHERLAVEDWGIAKFDVIEREPSAHQVR